jgi:hypothetical protein
LTIHSRLIPVVARLVYRNLCLRTAAIGQKIADLFSTSGEGEASACSTPPKGSALYASFVKKLELWLISRKTYYEGEKRVVDLADPGDMVRLAGVILPLCRPRELHVFSGQTSGIPGRPYKALDVGFWNLLANQPGLGKLRICGVEIDEAAVKGLGSIPDLDELTVWSCGYPRPLDIEDGLFGKLARLKIEYQMNIPEIRDFLAGLPRTNMRELDIDVSSYGLLDGAKPDVLEEIVAFYPRLRTLSLREGLGVQVGNKLKGLPLETFNAILADFEGGQLLSIRAECLRVVVDGYQTEELEETADRLLALGSLRDCAVIVWVQSSAEEQTADKMAAAKDRTLVKIAQAGRRLRGRFHGTDVLRFRSFV